MLKNIPKGNKWLIGDYKTIDEGESVAEAIIKGTAKAISDGSFKDYIGTSASIIVGEDRSKAITTCNKVAGNKWDQ